MPPRGGRGPDGGAQGAVGEVGAAASVRSAPAGDPSGLPRAAPAPGAGLGAAGTWGARSTRGLRLVLENVC